MLRPDERTRTCLGSRRRTALTLALRTAVGHSPSRRLGSAQSSTHRPYPRQYAANTCTCTHHHPPAHHPACTLDANPRRVDPGQPRVPGPTSTRRRLPVHDTYSGISTSSPPPLTGNPAGLHDALLSRPHHTCPAPQTRAQARAPSASSSASGVSRSLAPAPPSRAQQRQRRCVRAHTILHLHKG